jgi:hypothetical protein
MPWLRSKRVELDNTLIERCYNFGQQMVADYANGFCNASLAVSSHDAERNPKIQAKAKMAECAFAIYAGLSPNKVKWGTGIDAGSDIALGAALIDIKWTAHGRCLIWPYRKTEFFDSKNFDALVMVKGDVPVFWIQGWISKIQFKAQKQIAGPNHKLTQGTWYIDQDNLWSMEGLVTFFAETENKQ